MQAIYKINEGASCVNWIDKLGGFVAWVPRVPVTAAGQIGEGFPKKLFYFFVRHCGGSLNSFC
jgi:hypothetical protein